jgi:transcriptional regulator with XRE-family HTH domain
MGIDDGERGDDAKKPASRQVDPRLKKLRGERVRALRERLGMSINAFADATGGDIHRTNMSHLENGHSALTTMQVFRGLARASGVPTDVMEAYVDGDLPLTEVIQLRERISRDKCGSVLEWIMKQPISLARD